MSRFSTKRRSGILPLALTLIPGFAAAQQPNTPQAAPPSQPAPPASENGTIPPSTKPQTVSPTTPAQNPAQDKYGAPRNPIIGGPTDLDLSKPLSLDRAVRIGLQRQNTIAIAQQSVESANARLTQARSAYYPQLTPTLSYNASTSPTQSTTFNGQTFGGGSSNSESLSNRASASLTILDTGQRDASVGNSRRGVFAAAFGLGDQRQSVILNVTQDYYNLVRFKELVRVQQENVTRAELSLKIIEKQIEVGVAAKSDRLQSVSDLANARVSLLSAQSDYAVGEATLKNAMGVVTGQPLVLTDDRLPAPNPTPDKLTVDDYSRAAYANRLDVKQQQEIVNAQGYNVRLAFINAGLTVSATINEGYDLNPVAGQNRVFFRRHFVSVVRRWIHSRRNQRSESGFRAGAPVAGSIAADGSAGSGSSLTNPGSGPSAGRRRAGRRGSRGTQQSGGGRETAEWFN